MKRFYPSEQGKQDQIPLDGVMAEFREALNDEIEAATSSAASSAVPLINGKRLDEALGMLRAADAPRGRFRVRPTSVGCMTLREHSKRRTLGRDP